MAISGLLAAGLAAQAAVSASSGAAEPSPTTVSVDFEFRTRFERRTDRDFNSSVNDNRTDVFTRFRPGVTVSQGPWSGRFQFQYAHSWTWSGGQNFSGENRDLSLAFAQYQESGRTFRVGRQKIALGDERLIGSSEWGNLSRAMDGVRYTDKTWDLFGFALALQSPLPTDARVFGAAYQSPLGQTAYLLKTDDTAGGDVTVHTLSHRWRGSLGSLKAEYEAAGQVGEVGARDLSAYALHAGVTYSASPALSLTLEANVASGGSSAGHTRTFDNLYPTNHKFYGSSDLVGWRNMQELTLKARYKTDPSGTLLLAWHNFWLFDKSDSWYGAGGGANRRSGGTFTDPTGSSGRDLGWELNIEYQRALSKGWSVSLGWAVFEPGGFVKNLAGGPTKSQQWGFAMLSARF